MKFTLVASVLALALLSVACPSRTGVQQGSGEETVHERYSGPTARAFLIERADQLLLGPQADGRVGDFRLENDEAVFIVGDVDHRVGFGASGGTLLDAGTRAAGRDGLQQVLLYLDDTWPRQAVYQEVEVTDAGGVDTDAVLEARGHDSQDPTIRITTRYILAPRGRVLRLETTLTAQGRHADFELGDALQWGEARGFAPGLGFELAGKRPQVSWLAAEAPGVSYGYAAQGGAPFATIHGHGWSDANLKRVALEPGVPVTFLRHLFVGDGAVGDVLGEVLSAGRQPSASLSGQVTDTAGEAVGGAWIEITGVEGQPLTRLRADGEGRFSGHLPAGRSLVARATTSARVPVPVEGVAFEAAEGGAPLALKVSRAAALAFKLTDPQGAPVPGKLILVGREGTPSPELGPGHLAGSTRDRIYTLTGSGEVEVPPGRYTVYASRGPEYDLPSTPIDAQPGARVEVALTLRRVVDTPGWLAADFHQHAAPSADSVTPLEDRVLSNLAEGVEILGSSDHNAITDYAPVIARLGVGARIASIVGDEVTTSSVGHFNAFPLLPDPTAPAGGALSPHAMKPDEIFAALRAAQPTEKVIQVNHPRAANIGYFSLMGLPPGGIKASDARMSWGFDALEVFNGSHLREALEVMADWFAMLDQGGLFVATGNSDTHGVHGEEPGYARTMLFLGTDDPAAVRPEAVVHALKKARRAVVTNGPMIEASLQGVPVGGFVTPTPGGRGTLEVVVRAAPWIDVTRVEVLTTGGKVLKVWDGLGGKVEVLRLDERLEVPIDKPAWYVVRVQGERPMAPVIPGEVTALAFTNPIWVGVPVEEP